MTGPQYTDNRNVAPERRSDDSVAHAVTGEMVAQVQHQASEVIAHSLDLMQRRGIEIPTDLRGFATDPNQARDLATFATENNWD
ncbi:hypothetical protein KKF03_00490, partial [Patescibacteria group bacterium]|nr:hypothetical protein [Patescibacteria group bacterium]